MAKADNINNVIRERERAMAKQAEDEHIAKLKTMTIEERLELLERAAYRHGRAIFKIQSDHATY